MKNQCSTRCDDAPFSMPRFRQLSVSSPSTSRFGPISYAFQCEISLLYIWKPSWCSATGTTYFAPAFSNSSAHLSGSNFSARNIGIKSL